MKSNMNLLMAPLLFVAIGNWGLGQTEVRQPLREVERSFQAFHNGNDASALANLFMQDGWFAPFDGQVIRGSENLRDFFTGQANAADGPKINFSPDGYVIAGDLAYSHGTYTLSTPDGARVTQGNYLGVYRQVAGKWRIHRYMSNAVMPEESQP
jgi:uncharacterized protein (TIGR02246 family)